MPSSQKLDAAYPTELSIVIPVYNEGEAILPTLKAIERSVRTPHTNYLVYDFEEDTTLPTARQWQRDHPNLILIRNHLGPGPANALRTGFAVVSSEAVAVVMADSSDRHEIIDSMYALIAQGYSVVVGSRYMSGGKQRGGPWLKSTLSRLAGLSLFWLTGIQTRDVTNSFKMYRRDLLASLTLESKRGFEISMEIPVKAFVSGFPITEIPSYWQERSVGTSHFRLFKWLPHYMRWFLYAVLRRNRLWWVK